MIRRKNEPGRAHPRTREWVRRCTAAGLASAAVALAAGCASPGHPQPPSLSIPRLASDLTAERVGDEVHLRWSTPDRTTDGAFLPAGPLTARICRERIAAIPPPPARSSAPNAASSRQSPPKNTAAACNTVAQTTVRPGASSAVDRLPAALTTGDPQPLAYRVELLGVRDRTAGPSAPVYAMAGSAPDLLSGFTATDTADGALLRWTRESAPAPGESVRLDRTSVDTAANTATRTSAPAANTAAQNTLPTAGSTRTPAAPGSSAALVRLTAGDGDPGGVVDRTGEIGQTYIYTAQRVRTVTAGGRTFELRSPVAGPLNLTLRNVFPPAIPAALVGSPGPGSIDLSWEPVEEPLKGERLAGYRVYRAQDSATTSTWSLLTPQPVTTPSYRDLDAQPGATYRYRVTAIDTAGNESAPTAEITETAAQP